MAIGYSTKAGDNEAKAFGRALDISSKHATQVCSMIRGNQLEKAKTALSQVIAMKRAVAYSKSRRDLAHKKGMAAGRYPVKTCAAILEILEAAEANAQFKGMSTANLFVRHIAAQQGPATPHHGRLGGNAKRAHIEVVLAERKEAKGEPRKRQQRKKETRKEPVAEKSKPEVKKPEAKKEEKPEIKKEPAAEKPAVEKETAGKKPAEKAETKPEVKKETAGKPELKKEAKPETKPEAVRLAEEKK